MEIKVIDKRLKQDWDIFKALAPEELINLIQDKNISIETSQKIAQTLFYLGFNYLFHEYVLKVHSKKLNKEIEDMEIIYDGFKSKDFINKFLNNIENEKIKKMFFSQVSFFLKK